MSLIVGTMRLNSADLYDFIISERSTHFALSSTGAQRLPDLVAEEPVAHQVAALDDEFLALVALAVGELRVEIAERQPPNATCGASSRIT